MDGRMKKLLIALALVSCAAHAATEAPIKEILNWPLDLQQYYVELNARAVNNKHPYCIPFEVITAKVMRDLVIEDYAANPKLATTESRLVRIFGCK
jgi:hypothetical protein